MNNTNELTQKDVETIIANAQEFLSHCNLPKESKALDQAIEFALNEWQSGNTHWFRENPGHVTVPDVIKACVTFGWNSKRQFDHENKK